MTNKIKKYKIYYDDGTDFIKDNKEFLSIIDNVVLVTDHYHGETFYKISLKNKKLIELREWTRPNAWFLNITKKQYKNLIKLYGRLSSSKLGKVLYKNGKY